VKQVSGPVSATRGKEMGSPKSGRNPSCRKNLFALPTGADYLFRI